MPENEEIRKRFEIFISPERYRVLPRGFYKVRLIEVREGEGNWEEIFVLLFEVQDLHFRGCQLNGLINKSQTNKNGKLWKLIKVLSDAEYDIFDNVNLLDLVNKECYINVEQYGKINKIMEYISLRDFQDLERPGGQR